MVRRDKRNIGKKAIHICSNPVWNNRIGIIKGFRGDFAPGIPNVLFWDVRGKGIDTFPGDKLKILKGEGEGK